MNDEGKVYCDYKGQCPCKSLVSGLKCDTCRQATFGLSYDNPQGCTTCFCFKRSQSCQQNNLSWGQIKMPVARNLSIEYVTPAAQTKQDYEYVVVIQMEGTKTHREDAEIKLMNGLNLIPKSIGNVSISAYHPFSYPLYFQLPPEFLGDLIKSYGGFIRFSLSTEGCDTKLGDNILRKSPLIQIHSHHDFILDYFPVVSLTNLFHIIFLN